MRVGIAVLTVLFLCVPASSRQSECLKSASSVRDKYESWPSWGRNVKGHKGEKCWFPVDKHRRIYAKSDRHVAQLVERPQIKKQLTNEQQKYTEDVWDAMTSLGSPQQRINAAFHYLSLK